MSTNLNRRTFLALGASGAALAAAGCRPGTGDTAAGSSASKPVQLRLMVWASAAEAARYKKDLAVFTQKTGTAVKLEFLDVGGYQDKLNTLFAAGDPPDVMFQVGRWIGEYASRGVLADLGDHGDELDIKSVNQPILEQARYDGHLYGMPTGSTAIALVYDHELVHKLGLELPDDQTWSWNDFARFNAEIHSASGGKTYGTGFYVPWLPTITQWVRQHGQDLFTADGKLGTNAATISSYFELIQKMRRTGAFAPKGSLDDDASATLEQSPLGRRMIASQIIPGNQFNDLNTGLDGRLSLLRLPGEKGGARPGYTVTPTLLWCMAAKSKHPKEAAQLINFMTNDAKSYAARHAFLGVPINPAVATTVKKNLDAGDQKFVEFTLDLQKESLPPYHMEPAGAGQVQDGLVSLATEVEFERLTPQQAGSKFVSQAKSALQGAE